MKIYTYSLQGKRESNEDNHINICNMDNSKPEYNNINLLGVFDGHGGKKVSSYLKENLPYFFLNKFDSKIYSDRKLFKKYTNGVFDLLQMNLKQKHPRAVEYCGSTACIAIHVNNLLWTVNVGDSRSVLCNKYNNATQLTTDHKPNQIDEKKRIEQLGGKITFDGADWRVKTLSLSRTFGDLDCCPYVTHVPEINKIKLSSKDKFLIIGCDGLWDTVDNQSAVNHINNLLVNNYTGNYAKELAQLAYKNGSTDNITVVIYMFN